MSAFASNPFFKDLCINLISIIIMFMGYGTNPCTIVILQQEETKVTVLDTNLLRNVDPPLSPSESDTFNQGWLIICWRVRNLRNKTVKISTV